MMETTLDFGGIVPALLGRIGLTFNSITLAWVLVALIVGSALGVI
jgi:hypothetical protein